MVQTDSAALSPAQLDAAVDAANVPTLLLLLVQLTGDASWVEAPYDDVGNRMSQDLKYAVRVAARRAIGEFLEGKPMALPSPDPDLIVRMLSVSLGEDIPTEYGPMIRAEIAAATGAISDLPPRPAGRGTDPDVVVIGAGVSGICAAVRLREAGLPYTILERNDGVGGVWMENRYPAAAVDTPSHLYSYSFAPGDWPRWFGAREHIHRYLEDVAEQFEVLPHVRFGVTVESATFDNEAQGWVLETRGPRGVRETIRARVVISAVGAFNSPVTPRLPGAASFEGDAFHTARWPSDVDVAGKRVAVIGNGASAMQLVPAIAPEVAALTVFQLEPHWIAPFPKFQVPVPEPVRRLMRAVPLYHAWYRARLAWIYNDKLHTMLRRDPEWPHPERSTNQANDRYREMLTAYIESELGERTDLLSELVPTYPPLG